MKRAWAALIFLFIAIALGTIESLCISTNTDVCLGMLSEADTHMERSEIPAAQSVVDRLANRFEKESKVFNIFCFHSEVSQVNGELAALRRYARTGNTSEFLAASARIRNALRSIRSIRLPAIENVL